MQIMANFAPNAGPGWAGLRLTFGPLGVEISCCIQSHHPVIEIKQAAKFLCSLLPVSSYSKYGCRTSHQRVATTSFSHRLGVALLLRHFPAVIGNASFETPTL